jgi:hypothetical protein
MGGFELIGPTYIFKSIKTSGILCDCMGFRGTIDSKTEKILLKNNILDLERCGF